MDVYIVYPNKVFSSVVLVLVEWVYFCPSLLGVHDTNFDA